LVCSFNEELEVSEARRLRALEDENAKLKKLLAESMPRSRDFERLREFKPRNRPFVTWRGQGSRRVGRPGSRCGTSASRSSVAMIVGPTLTCSGY
jgi:hypothetical protein